MEDSDMESTTEAALGMAHFNNRCDDHKWKTSR